MENNIIELVFILDRSGSMSGLEADTIGGFNSLIDKQKKEDGQTIVSTVLFSDRCKVIHNRININKVPRLTSNEYYVSGCTALLDAIGSAINYIVSVHKNLPDEERPSKTMFFITTDGRENSSREFTYSKVKNMIELEKEKYGWEFIFLGANINVLDEAERLGINAENACDYNCDSKGTRILYDSISKAINESRTNRKLSSSWRRNLDLDRKSRKQE